MTDLALPAAGPPPRARTSSSWSIALSGLEGQPVEVEAMIAPGLPRTVLVGLPDASVYEARDRCRSAVAASGLRWPVTALTINLTPASLPKAGSHHDLAIAGAVLAADGAVPEEAVRSVVLLGELGLDGRVRRTPGILPATMAARDLGFAQVIVPAGQAAEAGLVEGIGVRSVSTLGQLVAVLRGQRPAQAPEDDEPVVTGPEPAAAGDFADIHGQSEACHAAVVAAAGRHHLLMIGPPGVGKTMIAGRIPGILPELDPREALEVASIRSLLGEPVAGLDRRPPFAQPHHGCSAPALVGGGARLARPGAASRAHRGVLFLDEVPEFAPHVLDTLRTPLETGEVFLSRSGGEARYPARFQLVMAANPCPCGNHGVAGRDCRCSPATVLRYRGRISGPLRDRVDITVRMLPPKSSFLGGLTAEDTPPSSVLAQRVAQARQRQRDRLAGTGWTTNAEVPGSYLRTHLPLPVGVERLERAVLNGGMSSRGVDRALRLAWTLADLGGRDRPIETDVKGAIALRRGTFGEGGREHAERR